MAILFEQIQNLYNSHLYEDVIYLSSTSLTYYDRNPELVSSTIRYQILYYEGMANYNLCDYKMAEVSFNAALLLRKVHKLKSKKGGELQSEADVKFSLHKCYLKMENNKEALDTLESIPMSQRNAEMHVSYLKLLLMNKTAKYNKTIITTCKEIIKTNPLSIFAIKVLIQSGLNFDEIDQLIKSSSPQCSNIDWLNHIIRALIHMENCDFKAAIESYRIVNDPSWLFTNIIILMEIAEAYYLKGDYQRCIAAFKQVRGLDLNYTNKLGIYAFVLHRELNTVELKKLAGQIMQCSKHSADVWVVLGYHELILSKTAQAFTFARKALSIQPNNIEALMLKGLASLDNKTDTTEAVRCFRQSTVFAPNNFEPYKLIVDYYITADNVPLATTAVCEIHKLLPCARSYALYASILSKDSTNIEKTKTLLENALQMDSECLDAVLLLARLHKSQGNLQAAVDVLKQYQPSIPCFKYHQLMADLLLQSKDKLNALDHSVLALKLDPHLPKVLNFDVSTDMDDSDWYNAGGISTRNLLLEGVLAESPAYEQDLILDT